MKMLHFPRKPIEAISIEAERELYYSDYNEILEPITFLVTVDIDHEVQRKVYVTAKLQHMAFARLYYSTLLEIELNRVWPVTEEIVDKITDEYHHIETQ